MNRRGFTLLEALVATLIMSVAVAGLLSSLSTSLRNAARLTDHDRAAMLAQRKMDELLLAPRLPRYTVVEGVWDPALSGGVESGWRARLTPFEMPPQAAAGAMILDRLELEVWWISAGRRRSFALEGFRRGLLSSADVTAGVRAP